MSSSGNEKIENMGIEDIEANRSWQPARSGPPPAAVASTPPPVDASILYARDLCT